MIETAVIILNWNGICWLKKFLSNVVRLSSGPGRAIYVADNCSTDGSADWIAQNFPEVNLIMFEKNHGFAGGYNEAIKIINAKYLVLLNSDIEVTEGWLDPLINFMETNPDAASCQPKIKSFHDKDYFEHAGAAGGFLDKFGYAFCRGRIFDHIEIDKGQYDNYQEIFWSTGACMITRSEAWNKCGGFDEDFFAHMEEIDLCWRFQSAGYKVCFINDSIVYHVGGGTLPYDSAKKTFLNFRNSLFMLYKNLPDHQLYRTIFIRKILDGIAAIMFVMKGKFPHAAAVFRAHLFYYRNLKLLKLKRKQLHVHKSIQTRSQLLNKSIVFWFYIKGKKTYSSIIMNDITTK